MSESPFHTHKHLLLDEGYSTARSLQLFVLSMYQRRWKFNGDVLSNFDEAHIEIFCDFARSYRTHGESDQAFMNVCRAMIQQREKWAANNLANLQALEALDPNTYEEGPDSHRRYVRDLFEQYERDREQGLIE